MWNRAVVAVVAFSLCGCSASSVNTKDPSRSRFAPIDERTTAGEISYCNAGIKTVRNARRDDAYQKMYSTCGGSYQIVREEDQHAAICASERRIWFKCVVAEPPAKPTS